MADDLSQARLAENEVLYRTVNEHIEDVNMAFEELTSLAGEWICECADTSCTTPVSATIEEYESVRADPHTFIVAPGHVNRESEHVVRGNERFTVVEKEGEAAEVAELHDARKHL
ncbi:MAG TPA: hypothetical protein VGH82_02470 [Gaiellaceae bacterium]|jgi:hypothetical protein